MDYGKGVEHFSLRWNNFHNNMKIGFHELLKDEDLVDVTIAVDGKLVQAHKMVLSVCSPFFKNIFKSTPCQHPVVFLKDVSHKELLFILQFMYLGEVSIQQEELGTFLKTAEALQIKGLSGDEELEEKNVPLVNAEKDRFDEKINYKYKVKHINNEPPDWNGGVKRKSFHALSQETEKRARYAPPLTNVPDQGDSMKEVVKNEPEEFELSDCESDRASINNEISSINNSVKNDGDGNDVNPNTSATSFHGEVYHEVNVIRNTFPIDDKNQEIRFVMSPRMRPCLVYNNYLYIKDHIGVAFPGLPKTIYWRCKDVTCKARCIQSDFKFRLKKNTYHQHDPNIDASYLPIHVEKAYDIIKFL